MEIKLHDIGEGMAEAEILRYLVKEGDRVRPDQPLVEVQTDKMTAEIPSPRSGIIKNILVETGKTVPVGTTLLLLEEDYGANSESKGKKPPAYHMVHMPVTMDTIGPPKTENKAGIRPMKTGHKPVLAAPYTRKIAREHGIDIEEVPGTGPAGRITDEDVYTYLRTVQSEEREKSSSQPGTIEQEKTGSSQQVEFVGRTTDGKANTIPFRGRRKQIAKKMVQSMFTIPHVTQFDEVDMTELLAFTKELKEQGPSLSVVPFFIKAIHLALKDYPVFNGKLDEEEGVIRLEQSYNIGLATDTEEGLIVPVIHNVEQKTMIQIQREMKTLTKKAQTGQLSMEDLTGGTFTVSNVGPFGSTGATPIINYPEVALIAFHKTEEKPVVRKGEITIRSMMNISFSFDHRVADGLTAVKFTNRFKELVENPKRMILELI